MLIVCVWPGPGGYPQQVWSQQQPAPGQLYSMPPQQHPPRAAMPAMPQSVTPQPPAQPSRASKRIAIINPSTGKEISTAPREEPPAAAGERTADAGAAQPVRAAG